MSQSDRTPRYLCFCLMLLGVAALYLPRGAFSGQFDLLGYDFAMLHKYRIQYAQENLAAGTLPAWYTRELCGAPFWSNVQNFPFIPTRLALLWLDPPHVFPAGVMLAAMLAAAFTFLLARRLGCNRIGSAAAGWTFAAAGFYAARIAAGHLPLLEAYPSLPALLWLVDRAISRRTFAAAEYTEPSERLPRFDWKLLWVAMGTLAFSLAGHPQLVIYAVVAAAIYVVLCAPWRTWLSIGAAMASGIGMSGFVLVPMTLLVGRSTRVLSLDAADNDIPLPYGRLLAAFFPWRDGSALVAPGSAAATFRHYPNAAYFWDTVWYVGWLPWLALAAMLAPCCLRAIRPDRRAWILIGICGAALLLALPITRELIGRSGGTLMRSPARLVYITTLGLSLGAGAFLTIAGNWLARFGQSRLRAIPILIIAVHAVDLSRHSRQFIARDFEDFVIPPDTRRQMLLAVGEGRLAIDLAFRLDISRRIDDVSFFDSIMLRRSYLGLMALQGEPPGHNNQTIEATALRIRALRMGGAAVLLTRQPRPNMNLLSRLGAMYIYQVPDPAKRGAFFPMPQVAIGTESDAERLFRDYNYDPTKWLIVEDPAFKPQQPSAGDALPSVVIYRRIDSDTIRLQVTAPADGYVRVLEAYDPGWRATLNGFPIPIVPANMMYMAVRVPTGTHKMELNYHTPGRTVGLFLSAGSLLAMILLGVIAPKLNAAGSRSHSAPA